MPVSADPPVIDETSTATQSPSSAPSVSSATPSEERAAPSAPTAAPFTTALSTADAPPKPDITAAEHDRLAHGYKPQMRNGEKVWCRGEISTGTRLSRGQQCNSADELERRT